MAEYLLLQLIVTAFVMFAISRSVLRFKDRNATLTELFLWIVVWGLVAAVAWVPALTEIPAKILGIGRGIDAMVYIAIVVLFYSVYRIYSKLERIEQEITLLTRHLALGKKRK
jgi:hypothetical protein